MESKTSLPVEKVPLEEKSDESESEGEGTKKIEKTENTVFFTKEDEVVTMDGGMMDPNEALSDPTNPEEVQESVQLMLQNWGHQVSAISPSEFLIKLLTHRGYVSEVVPSARLLHSVDR